MGLQKHRTNNADCNKEGRKEMFYLTTLSTHFNIRLYGVGHMVTDHSDSERGNPLPPHGLLFLISSKDSFICTIPQTDSERGRKEGNVLFNGALNTFYSQLYGFGHMVNDHSDSERGNPLPPHRLLFPINSKGYFICTIPQTG